MKFKICLTMLSILGLGSLCLAQETPNLNAPISIEELKEGIIRIEQGVLFAKETDLLRKSMQMQDELADRERAIAMRELDTEKQRTDLAEQKVTIEKARGDFYENAFKTVSTKTSALCKVARVFTFGLAKCGR